MKISTVGNLKDQVFIVVKWGSSGIEQGQLCSWIFDTHAGLFDARNHPDAGRAVSITPADPTLSNQYHTAGFVPSGAPPSVEGQFGLLQIYGYHPRIRTSGSTISPIALSPSGTVDGAVEFRISNHATSLCLGIVGFLIEDSFEESVGSGIWEGGGIIRMM